MSNHELQRVLIPVDFSAASASGLLVGAEIARRFGAHLTVLHVESATSAFTEALTSTATAADVGPAIGRHRKALKAHLEEFAAGVLEGSADAKAVVIDAIFVAEAIVQYAEEHRMDWICMGATGHRAIERLVLGDTAAEVLRRSSIPVLTLRSRREDGTQFVFDDFRRVLVAVDLGEGSRQLVERGATLARPEGRLTLLHVIESFKERGLYGLPLEVPAEDVEAVVEWCDGALGSLVAESDSGIVEPARVLVGRPAASILTVEREMQPDVTVVGTHGRHGMDRLILGSVAERVVRHALGPVLVVPNLMESPTAKDER